jgi:hypothetical protein
VNSYAFPIASRLEPANRVVGARRGPTRLIETSCGMRDLVVASLRCNELAREPSAGRWVWLVNEVPARCIRSVVWLERGETPSI